MRSSALCEVLAVCATNMRVAARIVACDGMLSPRNRKASSASPLIPVSGSRSVQRSSHPGDSTMTIIPESISSTPTDGAPTTLNPRHGCSPGGRGRRSAVLRLNRICQGEKHKPRREAHVQVTNSSIQKVPNRDIFITEL